MAHQQIEKRQVGLYGVIGELTFESVVHVEKEGLAIIQQSDEGLVFDLADVEMCSSAALALLLSWLRAAQQQSKTLSFKQIPEQLESLIKSAQLQQVIPVTT